MLGEIADLRLCALMSCLLFGAYLNIIVGGPFELVGKKLNWRSPGPLDQYCCWGPI